MKNPLPKITERLKTFTWKHAFYSVLISYVFMFSFQLLTHKTTVSQEYEYIIILTFFYIMYQRENEQKLLEAIEKARINYQAHQTCKDILEQQNQRQEKVCTCTHGSPTGLTPNSQDLNSKELNASTLSIRN